MQYPRRGFLQLAAAAMAAPGLPRIAIAQVYPTRAVHLISGFPVSYTHLTLPTILRV